MGSIAIVAQCRTIMQHIAQPEACPRTSSARQPTLCSRRCRWLTPFTPSPSSRIMLYHGPLSKPSIRVAPGSGSDRWREDAYHQSTHTHKNELALKHSIIFFSAQPRHVKCNQRPRAVAKNTAHAPIAFAGRFRRTETTFPGNHRSSVSLRTCQGPGRSTESLKIAGRDK